MAITVVKTPAGHKIIDQPIDATITNSGGDALVTFPYHGLGTGDHVYITSDIDDYAGFWYVTAIDTDTFKISEYAGADFVEHFQDQDIEYYTTEDHDWSAIFLPIIYKLSNDKWPVNTVDDTTSISSIANDGGYLEVQTGSDIKVGIKALDYVKISGAANDSANGVWQVVEVIADDNIVIDMAYPASGITGATIQYYYNNYQVKVKVFAGLHSGHPWVDKKPMEELAELSFTPDEDNIAMFSISDYIKGKIEIKNNPTLFSMPLDLDAFTGFYISVAEAYDTSDGYTIATDESDFEADTFEGYAVAGKLPFKNIYAGDYADYVYVDGAAANWLTANERLLAVEDKYFDISFIKNVLGSITVYVDKYVSDYLTTTETTVYPDHGIGVYRIPIEADASYDSFCVRVVRDPDAVPFTPAVMDPIEDWTNLDTGDPAWILNGTVPEADTSGLGLDVTSDKWHTDYAFEEGRTYSFAYQFQSNVLKFFHIDIVDVGGTSIISKTISFFGTEIGTYTFIAPAGAVGISIWLFQSLSCGSGSGNCLGKIESFVNQTESIPALGAATITEEICIDILESCDAVNGFTPTDIRLLEDGSYRILE